MLNFIKATLYACMMTPLAIMQMVAVWILTVIAFRIVLIALHKDYEFVRVWFYLDPDNTVYEYMTSNIEEKVKYDMVEFCRDSVCVPVLMRKCGFWTGDEENFEKISNCFSKIITKADAYATLKEVAQYCGSRMAVPAPKIYAPERRECNEIDGQWLKRTLISLSFK